MQPYFTCKYSHIHILIVHTGGCSLDSWPHVPSRDFFSFVQPIPFMRTLVCACRCHQPCIQSNFLCVLTCIPHRLSMHAGCTTDGSLFLIRNCVGQIEASSSVRSVWSLVPAGRWLPCNRGSQEPTPLEKRGRLVFFTPHEPSWDIDGIARFVCTHK
jgi:hypothetical protein